MQSPKRKRPSAAKRELRKSSKGGAAKPVFNKTIGLRDIWAKINNPALKG
jgi:hypothetical protein